MKTLLKLTITTLILITLTACNNNNGKGKQNSEHGLINTPPKAQTQSIKTDEDTNIDITIEAIDDDNDTIGYRVSHKPTHGKIEGKAPNLTYTPNKDYNGKDSFTFIANDGQADSNEATVEIDITPVADLKELRLKVADKELGEGESTTYSIEPVLDNQGKTPDINNLLNDIELIAKPSNSVEIDKNSKTIKALKSSKVTLVAKADDIISNETTLQILEVVNGYKLPPEPDEKTNNSTLLGIDSNGNGIRDDVERYIIKKYAKDPKYPKTKTAIALQYAWASQKILENPTMESKKYIDDAIDCQYYWFHKKQRAITHQMISVADTNMSAYWELLTKRSKWKKDNAVFNNPALKDKIYNTRERIEQKFRFNSVLSGNIFDGREENITNCQTNIDELGE